MKKSVSFLVTTILLSFFLNTAQGAIVFDPPYSTNPYIPPTHPVESYTVFDNGGSFYVPFPPFIVDNTAPSGTPADIRTENFMGFGANMTLSAAAAGVGIAPETIQVSGHATIDYNGVDGVSNLFAANTVGANVKQNLNATFQRQFQNTGTTNVDYQINASLAGTEFIHFDSFASGYSFAGYGFTAVARVEEIKHDTSGTALWALELSESTISGSDSFSVRPASEGYEYLFTVALNIQTAVNNYTVGQAGFASSELSGIFETGTIDNPLVLTASIGPGVPTPVPQSLFLLISGLAGISFMRYRRDQPAKRG